MGEGEEDAPRSIVFGTYDCARRLLTGGAERGGGEDVDEEWTSVFRIYHKSPERFFRKWESLVFGPVKEGQVSQPAHPPERELVAEKGEHGLSLSNRHNGEEHTLAAWASRRRGFPSSHSIPLLLSRRRFSWWLCIRTAKF